jgi:S-adenosylmethionine decarboxylase
MSSQWDSQFFEGPEKKVELVVSSTFPSLRDLGGEVWERVVRAARAEILSTTASDACTAYLLSESSLLVFDSRVVMITCGRTTLVSAVKEMLTFIPLAEIELLVYERKNELRPEYQRSNFQEDVRLLKEEMPGKAFRFGDEDDHHIYLFHLDRPRTAPAGDMTLEILMHGIDPEARSIFGSGSNHRLDVIRERTGVREIFSGFEVDDRLFEPYGYSLNAVKGGDYYTVHVTPQEAGSYVSFETNHCVESDLEGTVGRVLEIFRPKSFDILFFRSTAGGRPIRCSYELKTESIRQLECGYEVQFYHYFKPQAGFLQAEELDL